jgi:hypothetical protein
MNSAIEKHLAKKNDVRSHEMAILSERKVDSFTLCQRNFCMKGINLHQVQRTKNTFSLFE